MKPHKLRIIILLCTIPLLMGMGIDLYVPSLPAITHYFHTKASLTRLTVSLYMLGYATAQLFFGILSDNFGRRKILLLSGVLYTAVSFLAVYTPNIYWLIIIRLAQGASIAGLGVLARAISTDCFAGPDLTKMITYFCSSWALGPIIGPVIGGYLQHYFHWQANFYFFAIYGLVIFSYTLFAIPETNENIQPLNLKNTARTLKTIMTHPEFLTTSILVSLLYSITVLFNMIGPFLIQHTLHYSVITYAHTALFLGFVYFLGNFSNQFFTKRYSALQISAVTLTICFLTSIVMIALSVFVGTNIYTLMIPTMLIFLSYGIAVPNLIAKGLSIFPKAAGSANALFGSIMAGGVFIVTASSTALNTSTQTPMAITYAGILFASIVLLWFVKKLT